MTNPTPTKRLPVVRSYRRHLAVMLACLAAMLACLVVTMYGALVGNTHVAIFGLIGSLFAWTFLHDEEHRQEKQEERKREIDGWRDTPWHPPAVASCPLCRGAGRLTDDVPCGTCGGSGEQCDADDGKTARKEN